METVKRCTNCCISDHFPGITLDENGLCNLCLKFSDKGNIAESVEKNRQKIEKVISENRGNGLYDVIVSYSGGKDSSFTLYYLKEKFNLRILAFMIDNSFISNKAFVNASNFTSRLNIDLLIYKIDPEFLKKMFKKSLFSDLYNISQLTRANSACLTCINLINNLTLNEAVIRNIPMISAGYIEGQLPANAGVIKTDSQFFIDFRDKNRAFLAENIDERFNKYLDIADLSIGQTPPVIINPLLGLNYSEKEIYDIISKFSWEKPSDTGMSSSNCLLNDYAIAVHFEKYKFHSYEAEICIQVRKGSLDKHEALLKLNDIKPPEYYKEIIERLNI